MKLINQVIESLFDFLVIEVKKLNGYDNTNYLVSTESGQFIFKTYRYSKEIHDLVIAENDALLFLNDFTFYETPHPVPLKDQSYVTTIDINGQKKVCRLLTFITGEFLGEVQPTKTLFESLGVFLAELDLKLQKHSNYISKARTYEWDIQHLVLNQKYIDDIPQTKDQNVVRYFFQQFEECVRPVLPELRKQIIHNDANEWNILVKNGKVSGVIDFGDMVYSLLINELAIAITYACYDKENILENASIIIKAYHHILPLEEKEIQILYYLIAARLCISVCNSAHAHKTEPENKYASASEQSAWQMIYQWLAIGPIRAELSFRKAINQNSQNNNSFSSAMAKRQKHVSKILSVSYDKPIRMVKSAFQYMYDANGNAYLDAYNNIPHVGHSHPKVVAAGQRQMAQLNTNTRYLYDQLSEYAEKLTAKFPPSLNKVFFVNSGSAASDLAIRMAKWHTKFNHLMVMESGYHGNTQTSIDISDYKFNHPKGQGQKDFILKTPIPDTYKGKYTLADKNPGILYGKEAVHYIEQSDSPIAAFIAEPIVGCAGQVPLADHYLKEVYPAIRAQGGVCISDEVQTGFGRLGDYFWGYEAHGVVPDMVILGKPIANGHPMGAVICTDEIAKSFENGVEFFSSFGGNPVSCAIASAVLDVIDEEGLQENARTVGHFYQTQLKNLMKKHPCIGDVRGAGLFIGVEIVIENSKEPNTKLANYIKNELRNRNILISTDGTFDNILKSKPPLCFTKNNAQKVVNAIDEVITRSYEI